MYPLRADYETPIVNFIRRLRAQPGVRVHTNQLSTQLTGEYATVMAALQTAMEPELAGMTSVSFVLKILNVGIEPGQAVEV